MIVENLTIEMINATKEKNKERKDTIKGILNLVKNMALAEGIKGDEPISDELANNAILKEKKTIQEMIDTCPEKRTDLLEEYKARLAIINEFAPSLAETEEEIETLINGFGIELVKANRGKIMNALKGKANMKVANQIVASLLK